ncbi:MAG: hypothetical protein HQL10_03480 [Nitrospirae bacterium]|nr:hypothetical protein [Nitrospirota bacterium]
MIKMILKIGCLVVLLVVAFLVLAFWEGGDKLRWFGKETQKQSEKLADKADKLKETGQAIKDGANEVTDKAKKLKGMIEDKKEETGEEKKEQKAKK